MWFPTFETFTRRRLRELDPGCYTPEASPQVPAAAPQNRIEGMLFGIQAGST
jgi:hypothetical protein